MLMVNGWVGEHVALVRRYTDGAVMRELIRIVQAHMDEFGVSEAEIARRIGANPQTVNTWRNGEMKQLPRQQYLEGLAELTKTGYATVLSAALIDTAYITAPLDSQPDHVAAMIGLSFLADDLEDASQIFGPTDITDEDEVADYVSAVEDLQNAAHYLTQAIHEAVLEAVGGDISRLRQVKREIRRFNRAKTLGKAARRQKPDGGQRTTPSGTSGESLRHVKDGLNEMADQIENGRRLLDESLLGHYVDMFLRALEDQGHEVLVQQARELLGDDVDRDRFVAPEIGDELYTTYIAARHSAIQGGDDELHAATELTIPQREAATARYRRERSEMILFDGRIRTAGSPTDVIAEAIHRVAPPGYTLGQGDQGEADGEGSQVDPDTED